MTNRSASASPVTTSPAIRRRGMLVASTVGGAGFAFGSPVFGNTSRVQGETSDGGLVRRGPARSTILFFLCGGASHIDMWDLKPKAPIEYRGPFNPVSTSAPGVLLSEHLPLLSRQAHHLALLNSVGAKVNTNDHHAGYYYNLTGHEPDPTFLSLGNNRTPMADDWPFMGSVVASRRPRHPWLPNAITLPHKPSKAPYTRPGQFSAKLGVEHDPLYLQGNAVEPLRFHAPSLKLMSGNDPGRMTSRRELLSAVDRSRQLLDGIAPAGTWSRQQDRAFSLLTSSQTAEAFDVSSEPESLRQRYGETVNGMSLLMARRLVEAEVPFITVFWKENEKLAKACKSAGGWDTHGDNFNCLKNYLLPEFDRCYSALIEDLADRGLLEQTLVLVTSEMGRTPKIGDRRSGGAAGAGRDHWTHCLTDVMAGGGIKGGQTYGSSDRLAEYPAEKPLTPADVTRTVYHAMGIQDLQAVDAEGRPFNLLSEGDVISDLF
ncbi:MAG: DUF1501 domain-containing protein [Planctomycetaceae bacterium]|nr:DUF1501 domain-containing protein [Planctomycetaceae bacterium]